MSRMQETADIEARDTFFNKQGSDDPEQRGRRYKLPTRHEFGNKNIHFKGTVGANANEFLRSRSQMSRNSSTHSNNPGTTRHHSITSIPPFNNPTAGGLYPSNRSLLSTYNEKLVTDTVLPVRTANRPKTLSRQGSRASSTHSFKKNYTFGSESLFNLRDRQDSLIGNTQDDDSEYRLDMEIRKRFNKAASISGPAGNRRAQELKKSSLNHSFNASSDSSSYSIEENDDGISAMDVGDNLSYESLVRESVENLAKQSIQTGSASPKSQPLQQLENTVKQSSSVHDQPMRTLQRQMNIREQALFIDKDEHGINEFTQKWNGFVSLDDKRMFELITNDLRKITRYNQKPVVEGLRRCCEYNYLALNNKPNSKKDGSKSFDLTLGREQIKLFWNEINDSKLHEDLE